MTDRTSTARPVVVINVVGLTWDMIGPRTPHIRSVLSEGFGRPMSTVLPAVTCSVQASLLTGRKPDAHGIVGNGWYDRDMAEVWFWKQSNALIQSDRIYQTARQRFPGHTTAKLFWWYNMYADVDWSVTPRPSYPADGRKLPDIYTQPADLRDRLQQELGPFPLFRFWGPTADIRSSAWIADASVDILKEHRPTLLLSYLPHLDYNLQRLGPSDPELGADIELVDREAGKIIQAARQTGAHIVVLSEYGITDVRQPVHINRVLREAGYLAVRRETLGWETLDCGASRAFAVADHQTAHVYIRDSRDRDAVQRLLEKTDGIERVLDPASLRQAGLNHRRSGDLVAVSARDAWFTWYFWTDDARAPDYARTVDIHRKPGYDPVELFVDPQIRFPRLHIARRLLQKVLGFRYYMDVIGLDAGIVRGSHGRLPDPDRMETDAPVFVCSDSAVERDAVSVCDVHDMILQLHGT